MREKEIKKEKKEWEGREKESGEEVFHCGNFFSATWHISDVDEKKKRRKEKEKSLLIIVQ